jgi:phage/plasmid-associated DNA primase
LRLYLNPETFAQLPKSPEGKIDASAGIIVKGVFVPSSILVEAKRDQYSLSKQTKLFQEELFDSPEMYEEEEYFLPPRNILPFKNGFLDLAERKFYLYGSRGIKGFLYQFDANYRAEYKDEYLPEEFWKLILDGISDPACSKEVNEKRYRSMVYCLAYSFIPTNPQRKFFIVIGPTACGKSTLVSIMRAVFGNLGCHLQSYSFMRKSRYDHELRPDLESTIDKLWVDLSETDEKQTIDAVTIKSYTGNDPLTYRKPHSDLRIAKVMNAKIWVVTNTFPKIVNYKDTALQDRLVIFDWYNSVPAENRDSELVAKLTTDENRDRIATFFAGIAARLYPQKTLPLDDTVMYNTKKYFLEQEDLVAQFYESLVKSEYDIPANFMDYVCIRELYNNFFQFLEKQMGVRMPCPVSQRTFEMRFAELADSDSDHFVKREKFVNGHFYRGLSIFPRPWGFKTPANFSQAAYGPSWSPPMQSPGHVPSFLPPSQSTLPSPSTETEDDESLDTFNSSQPGDGSASSPPRYVPS